NFIPGTKKTWEVSVEKSLGKSYSLKGDIYQRPKQSGPFGRNILIADLEIRKYLGRNRAFNNLSGQYLSVSKTFNFNSKPGSYFVYGYGNYAFSGQNRYFNEANLGQIKWGQQYGGMLDVGLKLGLK